MLKLQEIKKDVQIFYEIYPQIWDSLTPKLQSAVKLLEKRDSLTPISGQVLINKLSFTHIVEFIKISDFTKRAFYEVESMRGNWSVRELKRQIQSLYYERSGLSLNKEKLSELAHKRAEKDTIQFTIRDPYVFEFLGSCRRTPKVTSLFKKI